MGSQTVRTEDSVLGALRTSRVVQWGMRVGNTKKTSLSPMFCNATAVTRESSLLTWTQASPTR